MCVSFVQLKMDDDWNKKASTTTENNCKYCFTNSQTNESTTCKRREKKIQYTQSTSNTIVKTRNEHKQKWFK